MKAIIEKRVLPDGAIFERVDDVAVISVAGRNLLEKVGCVVRAKSGAVLYSQAGSIKRFGQRGRSKSLRRDRVKVKRMLRLVA